MKKIILLAALSAAMTLGAQTDSTKKDTTYWKTGAVAGLNFSQVSLTNWSAGGQSSVSALALFSASANYKKARISWDNTLDLAYGMLKQGNGSRVLKSDDKIDLSSKLGIDMRKSTKWFYSALLGFRTQFVDGFTYATTTNGTDVKISDFLAPGYVVMAFGMDYKPNDNFSAMISPLTGRVTLVNDQALADAGAFGVAKAERDALGNITTPGKKHREEFGGYIKATFKKDIMTNVNLGTKIELFSNYLDRPQNVDVNWEMLIAMKVNKFLTASISTQLIYDNDINIGVDTNNDGVVDRTGPRVQFKEVLGIGIQFKF